MAEIFKYFLALDGVEEFWRNAALDWSNTYQVLKLRVSKLVHAPTFHTAAVASLKELVDFYELLLENRSGLIVRHFEVGQSRPLASNLSCNGIAPPGGFVLQAQQRLAWELEQHDQKREPLNDYSLGVHLKFGDCSVFLTGDAGRASWPASRRDEVWQEQMKPGAHVFLKAPHHGSVQDSPDWFLSLLAGARTTSTAITRYSRSKLPRATGLARFGILGDVYRLSERTDPTSKAGLAPEYLEVEVKPDGFSCRRCVL